MKEPKIGILGGGQLGRMMLQVARNYPGQYFVLDPQENAPARFLCDQFTQGSLLDEETVISFGKDLDIITIEIENVNVAALKKLKGMGKTVIPDPKVLETIQDKATQNKFYKDHDIPTPIFQEINSKDELNDLLAERPLVQKLRRFGYDGKGVQILESVSDIAKAFDGPTIVEEKIRISMEIGVVVIKPIDGDIKVFPPAEMVFDPELNLVDYLITPAELSSDLLQEVEATAIKTVEAFGHPGIYAIEMFIDEEGRVLVNETAPRTHNSGHSTIEGNFTSQFEQHVRILLGLKAGDTAPIKDALMFNVIGPKEIKGKPIYKGLAQVSGIDRSYVHLYGKGETKPGRKMGHVTILGDSREELVEKMRNIRSILTIEV